MAGHEDRTSRLLQHVLASAPPDVWLALDCEEGRIIATGPDLLTVRNQAKAQGFTYPLMVYSPHVRESSRKKHRIAA